MNEVYENFVRQLAGDVLQQTEGVQEALQESVQRSEQKAQLQKQIDSLQVKIRKDKQMEVNTQLKKLRKELEAMK